MKQQVAIPDQQVPGAHPARRGPAGGNELLDLQRTAGNRAVGAILQRQKAPAKPAVRDLGAVLADLEKRDSAEEITTELANYSHEERVELATRYYSTPVEPGHGSSTFAKALSQADAEAVRIGVLNGNYAAAYGEQRWPDIIRFLNAYSTEDIAHKVAGWNQYELQEGIHQARTQLGPGASVRLTGPMLDRVPPPAVGPGTGAQLIATGPGAIQQAVTALSKSAPCTVNGGALGDVLLKPGSYVGSRMLVSATPTGVVYSDGPALFQMYAPDFVRDVWLAGMSEGAARAEPMVALAKAEFAFIIAFFVPWYGALALGALEAIVTYDENRAEFAKLKDALPRFLAARAEFKKRYPTLYDAFFQHCFWELVHHLPEGIEMSDVAYLLGRIIGAQGLLGAWVKALEKGVALSVKTCAVIIAEYFVLVSIVHAPGIAGRAAAAAVESGAKEIQQALARDGITVNKQEAALIAKELVASENPEGLLDSLQKAAQDMGDAAEIIEKSSKKHSL